MGQLRACWLIPPRLSPACVRRYKELAMCKQGVLLVNYARGECLHKQV